MENKRSYVLTHAAPRKSEYPMGSILVAMLLIYLSPFTSYWLSAAAFLICLYRVIRYDARVFSVDYCFLAPIVSLTRFNGGVPLVIYLCLIAGIWYFIRGGMRADAGYAFLLLLLNHLFARMQLQINDFVLCFGQMFVMCVLLPKQDEDSAERGIKAFCVSLTVSSIYAWLLRDTYQIRILCGADTYAIWGSNILRFKGLLRDPNYYTTLLIVGLALLLKLRDCKRIGTVPFFAMGFCMAAFGILTYSKTFFLMFLLLGGIYVLWQFWNGKIARGVVMAIVAVVALVLIFTLEDTVFSVVLTRLRSSNDLSDLTTSRTDVYLLYLKEITEDLGSFLFGKGLAAQALYRDPHNLYLEIIFYTGVLGLVLLAGFYGAMVQMTLRRVSAGSRQNVISKYVVLAMVLILYFSLHGMFESIMYAEMYLGVLSILLTKKKPEKLPEAQSEETL